MERNVSPGLFHLPLPINQGVSKDAIRMKVSAIVYDLKEQIGLPEELAILNLLGHFKFRLEEYENAEEYFGKALEKDKHNLNAMANMAHVLEEVDRSREAKAFKHKLDESRQSGRMARARCLAEQAYAYACDLHTDEGHLDRFIKSNAIFQEAIDLAGDLAEASEKDIWKFRMATNSHKIFNEFTFKYKRDLAIEHMEKAVKLFHELTERGVEGGSEYTWESWRNLADIFRKLQTRVSWGSGNLPQELTRFIDDPEQCMRNAMKISPNNPKLLARYGNFVYTLSRERTQKALKLLDESIMLDNSESNFYAFSTRGRVLLGQLEWRMKKTLGSYRPLDKSTQKRAISDLEQAIKFRNAVFDLINMAKLYRLMAQTSVHESKETRKKYLKKVFAYLTRATKSEGGEGKQYANKTLGRCLFDVGEYRDAVSCFKEANANLTKTAPYVGYFHEMFRSYLCWLRSESKHGRDSTPILIEMADSLKQAVGKHGVANLVNYCFSTLQGEYQEELFLLTKHCEGIPNNEHMLEVLTSKEPPSSLSPSVRKGGSLRHIWLGASELEEEQSATPHIAGSAEAVSSDPTTRGNTGEGIQEVAKPQSQEEPRVEYSAVVKRDDFGDLATAAAAGAITATQSGSGNVVNININASNSPVNFGTTHGSVTNYDLPEGRGGDVSTEEIGMLVEWKKVLGEKNFGKMLSEGLKHVQKQGGLLISPADEPSSTLAITQAGEPTAISGKSRHTSDDVPGGPEGAVASVTSKFDNIDIK